jgi:hypothetical protein
MNSHNAEGRGDGQAGESEEAVLNLKFSQMKNIKRTNESKSSTEECPFASNWVSKAYGSP